MDGAVPECESFGGCSAVLGLRKGLSCRTAHCAWSGRLHAFLTCLGNSFFIGPPFGGDYYFGLREDLFRLASDGVGAWLGGFGVRVGAHGGLWGGIIDFYARDWAGWRERADGAGVCGVSAGREGAEAGEL